MQDLAGGIKRLAIEEIYFSPQPGTQRGEISLQKP
jgi:hypothetical protein